MIPDESHWVNVTSPAGGVEMHHCNMLHSSTANRGAKPRSAVIIQYRAADNVQLSPGLADRPGFGMQVRGATRIEARLLDGTIGAAPDPDQGSDPARRLSRPGRPSPFSLAALRRPSEPAHDLDEPVVRQRVRGDPVAPEWWSSAATSALMIASSVASMTPSNSGSIARSTSIRTSDRATSRSPSLGATSPLPVAQARNRSPDECPPVPPARAIPSPARWASRSHWWGRSGASVAMRTMIEPEPGRLDAAPRRLPRARVRRRSRRPATGGRTSLTGTPPTGTPSTRSQARRP